MVAPSKFGISLAGALFLAFVFLAPVTACDPVQGVAQDVGTDLSPPPPPTPPEPPPNNGSLEFQVDGLNFDGEGVCAAPSQVMVIFTDTITFKQYSLTLSEVGLVPDPDGSGDHFEWDSPITLPAGDYFLQAVVFDDAGFPANCCMAVGLPPTVTILDGDMVSIYFVIVCSELIGAGNVGAILNDAPQLEVPDGISYEPNKKIGACVESTVTMNAFDPNEDAIGYMWKFLSGPAGANFDYWSAGNTLTFAGDKAGQYWFQVTITDDMGAVTTQKFYFKVFDNGEVCPDLPLHICG